jgi:hypothetical protein
MIILSNHVRSERSVQIYEESHVAIDLRALRDSVDSVLRTGYLDNRERKDFALLVRFLPHHICIGYGDKDNNGNMVIAVVKDHTKDKKHRHYGHIVVTTLMVRRINQMEKIPDDYGGYLTLFHAPKDGGVELLG